MDPEVELGADGSKEKKLSWEEKATGFIVATVRRGTGCRGHDGLPQVGTRRLTSVGQKGLHSDGASCLGLRRRHSDRPHRLRLVSGDY